MMGFIKKSIVTLLFFVISFGMQLHASSDVWPKELKLNQHLIVFYQPQPESLHDNTLKALAAISVESEGDTEPLFGAVWFEARVSVDKSQNRAQLDRFELEHLRFPDEDSKKFRGIERLIRADMPHWELEVSYQKLLSSLDVKQMQSENAVNIKTDAPKIIVTQKPSVLITIDGEPRLKAIENSKLLRVINTPYTIIMDTSKSMYYLNADKDVWYASSDIKRGWHIKTNIPKEVMKHQPESSEELLSSKIKKGDEPEIVIATGATELVSCDGKLEFTPISTTGLMYVSNTQSDLFLEIATQKYYLLLAGRWFESSSLQKGWRYVKSDALPAGFAKIPEDSDSSNVLYAVAGTTAAKDAVLDAQVPQAASVDRRNATLNVSYDGNVRFEKIMGTSMKYIANTQTPVIFIGNRYYACDNAIWFVANDPYGAWSVATSIPDVIYTIPPSSPLYNVTYVKVYKVTDDAVYVGYTSGYTNTYVYNTTIVYGTGYIYPSWYGSYYYPRPVTWGYHARWDPYGGWGFGLSYSTGPFSFMIGSGGWYSSGWWGPSSYRGYGYGYHRGHHKGYRQGYINGIKAGHRPFYQKPRVNFYHSSRNSARIKQSFNRGIKRPATPSSSRIRPDRVHTPRGTVERKVERSNRVQQNRLRPQWSSQNRDNFSNQKSVERSYKSRNQVERGNRPQQNRPRPQWSSPNKGNFSNQKSVERSYKSRDQVERRSNRDFTRESRERNSGDRGGNFR